MRRDAFWNVANEVVGDDDQGYAVQHTEWFPGLLDTLAYLRNMRMYGDPELPVLGHAPGVIIEAWCIKQKVTFDQFTRDPALKAQFLNDPDNSQFRVKGGRA